MKRFVILILAAGLVFSAAGGASAVDVKVSGDWQVGFNFMDNMYNDYYAAEDHDGHSDGTFRATQRIRINMDIAVSEALSGRVQLQAAQGESSNNYYTWGENSVGGPGKSVTARLTYLDWLIPSTDVKVRMGRQAVAMPSYTFGSSVLDDVIDGVVVNAPVNDMVAVNVGWLRADAEMQKWGTPHNPHSSIDLAFLAVDVASDGFKVTPWGMVGFHGSQTDDFDMVGNTPEDENTTAYWVGIGGELSMFDPFTFTADFLYSGNDGDRGAKRSGWYAALGAEMKTAYVTPFLRGWYASGDDDDADGESGRMLSIDGAGGFDASGIYFGYYDQIVNTPDVCTAAGTWGVQLGVKEVSFIEDLTHMLSVTYFQGTNDDKSVEVGKRKGNSGPVGYMTTEDSAWSIDFMNSYKLYQNLTANLLLSYLVTDFDRDVWGRDYDNIFRSTLNFTYSF